MRPVVAVVIKLGRHVALKFLREEYSQDPMSVEGFERESRGATARFRPC
jgi:hypothetical protein